MKKLLTLMLVVSTFVGCSYDDDELWDKVNDINSRLETLEQAANDANSNISNLKSIVDALQNNVTVSSVVPVSNGYIITFSNGETATISNGINVTNAPVISIRKDTDNIYYWIADGEWLLVDGEKVKAQGIDGTNGKDAIVPQIRINPETEEWEISTNNGETWKSMGPAISDNSDEYIFSAVEVKEDCVIITLTDGTEIELQLTSGMSFVIDTAGEEVISIKCGATKTFGVNESGVVDYTISKPDGWKVSYENNLLSITSPVAENIYADRIGVIAFHLVSKTGSSAIVKINVKAIEYELRILTFEDEDYKGGENSSYWTSLIDNPQYGGPLLYGDYSDTDYKWYDNGNTNLGHEFPFVWNSRVYWGGGHAISNYIETDISQGDHLHQLAVYYKDPNTGYGGNNGSKNFCVHYGYVDQSGFGNSDESTLPTIYFTDNEARVIDHMYVTSNTYLVNCVYNGNSLTDPVGESDYVRIEAIGFDENSNEIPTRLYFNLATNEGIVADWQKWDLSSFGKVVMIRFNVTGSNDNGYGFSQPAYFAYDDVAVRF